MTLFPHKYPWGCPNDPIRNSTFKDLKDRKAEVKEIKERKLEKIEKIEIKERKLEKLEFEKPRFDKPPKELVEGPNPNFPVNPITPAPSGLEQRLAELEAAMTLMQGSGAVEPMKKIEIKELKEKEKEKEIKEIKEIKELKEKERKEFKEKDFKDLKDKEKDKAKDKEKEKEKEKEKDKEREKEKDKEKEIKEFKDVKEIKERKEKDIKEIKEFKEKEKDIFEGPKLTEVPEFPNPQLPIQQSGSLEERLAYLEATLAHFIGSDLRPDLAAGALNREPDLSGAEQATLSQQLQKQAGDAKQMKDNKDLEKMREM